MQHRQPGPVPGVVRYETEQSTPLTIGLHDHVVCSLQVPRRTRGTTAIPSRRLNAVLPVVTSTRSTTRLASGSPIGPHVKNLFLGGLRRDLHPERHERASAVSTGSFKSISADRSSRRRATTLPLTVRLRDQSQENCAQSPVSETGLRQTTGCPEGATNPGPAWVVERLDLNFEAELHYVNANTHPCSAVSRCANSCPPDYGTSLRPGFGSAARPERFGSGQLGKSTARPPKANTVCDARSQHA